MGRPAMIFKKLIKPVLWLAVLGLAAWALAQLPFKAIAQSVAALSWQQWLLWSGVNALLLALATQRWWLLLAMLQVKVGFIRLLLIRQAGQAVNFITPGPQVGGEPLQVFWLCRQQAVPMHKAILSLGLDRFYEVAVNFSLLLLGVALLIIVGLELVGSAKILALLLSLLLALALLGWLLVRQPLWLKRSLLRLAGRWQQQLRLEKIKGHWQTFSRNLQQLFNTEKPRLLLAVLLSLITWLVLLGEFKLLLDFVDIQTSWPEFIFLVVAMRLALLLPVPGGIGPLEAAVFWSCQSLGLPSSAAISLIALMRLRDALVLLAGLLCLRWLQLRTAETTANPA